MFAVTDNPLTLDELYKMTAEIYGDRNSARSREATFAHFVEVCGMLTIADRKKKREKVDFADALCKALGWYFPLLAKMRVQSVEALVFRKFPGVCPYCRQTPHEEVKCKLVKGTEDTLNHAEVITRFRADWSNRPRSLNDWQSMFNRIYPRSVHEGGRSTIGLLEELGEMAEALRVFDAHPQYFLGEAADTFSYIMGLANEHELREAQEERHFSFEHEFIVRYPGICTQCGSKQCACPTIPAATIGRMAKEIRIQSDEQPFIENTSRFNEEGRLAAQKVFEKIGGYSALVEKLPFDRGDVNHALVQLCMMMASALESSSPRLASTLRAEAIRVGDSEKKAGTLRSPVGMDTLINDLKAMWRSLDEQNRQSIKSTGGMVGNLGTILDMIRVLFVSCNPDDSGIHLKLQSEQRAIKEALRQSQHGSKIVIEDLPAATTNDLRRALLHTPYDLIHFSGHADDSSLLFEDDQNRSTPVSLDAVSELIGLHPSVKCVVLNACDSAKSLKRPISKYTIGMDESIPDKTAIEFSRGFYDALGAGRDIERAFAEGTSSVKLAGLNANFIRLLTDK